MIEKIQSFISQHPLLTGIIGLGVMLLFVLILFIPSTSKELSPPSQTNTNANDNAKNNSNFSQTKTQTTPWVVGQNENYIISFPQSWNTTTRAVAGGGTAVTLTPPDFKESEPFPILYIESTPANVLTPTQKAATLAPLKMTQTETTFKSNPAIQISGTLPFTPGSSNPNQSLIHKTYLIFQHSNNLYMLSYAEYEDKNQQTNEQLMRSILNTIQFND